MDLLRVAALMGALIVFGAAPAYADLTGFIGANTTPENRMTRGFSGGLGVLLIGFEFEYANTAEDVDEQLPSLKTYSGNLLLQTPFSIFRMQPYFTTGAGLYRERLGAETDTGIAFNTGGGVKVDLIGPLRVRVDYRVFRLGSDALYSPAHRLYAGINLKF
jgi:hypothetical protein